MEKSGFECPNYDLCMYGQDYNTYLYLQRFALKVVPCGKFITSRSDKIIT